MDIDTIEKIATFLTSKDLIIGITNRPISPAEHHRIMVNIVNDMIAKFGLSMTSRRNTGLVETTVAIPVTTDGHKIEGNKNHVTPQQSKEDNKKSHASGSQVVQQQFNSSKIESKTTRDASLLDSEKVYTVKSGGWLKAMSEVAKHIRDNPDAPRSDPMRIAFNGSRSGKMIRINFWIDDILAFAELYDKHGNNIRKVFNMRDEEYDGTILLKNVEVYHNEYPAYTTMRTRAQMFAPCIGKFTDECLGTAVLSTDYMNGDGTWSDAYMHKNTKLCIACFHHQRDNEFEYSNSAE